MPQGLAGLCAGVFVALDYRVGGKRALRGKPFSESFKSALEWRSFWGHSLSMSSLLARITISSGICHGKPVIRNLRYPVESMLSGKAEIGKAESRNK